MRLPSIPNKLRFHAAWGLVVGFAAFWLVLFVAELKAGVHHPYTHNRVSQGCVKASCAQVGDSASYVVRGRVVSVAEPQPGVVCVQLQSPKQASQVCEPK